MFWVPHDKSHLIHVYGIYVLFPQIMVDVEDRNDWKECIDFGGVRLPTGYYFGASAATGDLSGKCYFHTSPRCPDLTDTVCSVQIIMTSSLWRCTSWWWNTLLRRTTRTGPRSSLVLVSSSHRKVTPLICSFRHIVGRQKGFSLVMFTSKTDNIDDPTGNFRSTPLTGWKVFLLLLCALLGIVVCAVVGAVVFQKRQERNKRFY